MGRNTEIFAASVFVAAEDMPTLEANLRAYYLANPWGNLTEAQDFNAGVGEMLEAAGYEVDINTNGDLVDISADSDRHYDEEGVAEALSSVMVDGFFMHWMDHEGRHWRYVTRKHHAVKEIGRVIF